MEECPLNNRYLQHSPLTIALKSLNFSLWLLWPFRIGCQEVDFYYWPSRGTPPATLIERHELALRWPLRKQARTDTRIIMKLFAAVALLACVATSSVIAAAAEVGTHDGLTLRGLEGEGDNDEGIMR